MTIRKTSFSDRDLDKALDCLVAPTPSDTLRHRVGEMAPRRGSASARLPALRGAAAAVLALAIGGATLLQTTAPSAPRQAVVEPAGITTSATAEILAQDIPLIDGPASGTGVERFSIAGLPLE